MRLRVKQASTTYKHKQCSRREKKFVARQTLNQQIQNKCSNVKMNPTKHPQRNSRKISFLWHPKGKEGNGICSDYTIHRSKPNVGKRSSKNVPAVIMPTSILINQHMIIMKLKLNHSSWQRTSLQRTISKFANVNWFTFPMPSDLTEYQLFFCQ